MLVLSGEARNTNLIVLGLTRTGLEPKINRTRGEQLTITPPMWLYMYSKSAIKSQSNNSSILHNYVVFNTRCYEWSSVAGCKAKLSKHICIESLKIAKGLS